VPRPVANPPNPWHAREVELLEPAPPAALEVYEESARSIVTSNDSPDVPFTFSVNPYRGCFHGCAYCYARPGHQYLDWGAGTDFERRIVVKVNAPERLRQAFLKPSWRGEALAFSGVTDCYQPLEASYQLTRRCLEVCLEFRNPVGVITKGALVQRDAALLGRLAREARASVYVSIPFADDATGRAIEPYASSVSRRFETLRVLADAGVPVGVAIAPVIPGLNDSHIPEILERAREAGATSAFRILLRLPAEVRPVFEARLREAFPLRAEKVLNGLREMKGGALNRAAFGTRMRGEGPRWQAVSALFDAHVRRLGFEQGREIAPAPATTFRRPGRQRSLFGDD
jgi:DNA repair photolyase